jgi:hypothetical protein
MKHRAVCLCAVMVCLLASPASAQVPRDTSANEAAIREMVAKADAKFTDDAVVWADGYLRPFRMTEEFSVRKELHDPAVVNRKNVKMSTSVLLIQFSAAADMAYEYSNTHVSYEEKTHVEMDVPVLRVWRKSSGNGRLRRGSSARTSTR